MPLYADDAVFMPPNSPSSVGAAQIRDAYVRVFETITLSVEFNVAELRQTAPDWAFVRTNSAGTQRVNATGATTKEANQELFIFQKVQDSWKIARYSFSTTNPPEG